MATQTRQWQLTNRPVNEPTTTGDKPTWTLKSIDLPALRDSQVLLKTLYLSNDPAQRGWMGRAASMEPGRFYTAPVGIGEPMRARGIGEVLESTSAQFKKGDHVLAGCNWAEKAVVDATACTPLPPLPTGLSMTHYLGALGSTGLTAYYGLVEVVRTKPIDVVVVSGAAGATGSMVVQIAKKVIGCRKVIGIAGGNEKCEWVKSLGADVCVDYKSGGDMTKKLKDALGQGVYADVYFDNVGGEILDAMLTLMVNHGRIAACGAVSTYNNESGFGGIKNWFPIVVNRLEIRGFIIFDYLHKTKEVIEVFRQAIADGRLKIDEKNETVVDTKFEDVPQTWGYLFSGKNVGKLVTKITS